MAEYSEGVKLNAGEWFLHVRMSNSAINVLIPENGSRIFYSLRAYGAT